MNEFYERRKFLVKELKERGIIKSKVVEQSFLSVPREKFVWTDTIEEAYFDVPLPLGHTGQTISAPHMVAMMLEELDLTKGLQVLEIGTGSGYNAALMAHIITDAKRFEGGKIITIERVHELVQFAKRNLDKTSYSKYVEVIEGDGSIGWPPYSEKEYYDRIIITAATPKFPKILVKQLKVNGIILAPIGSMFYQVLTKGTKTENGQIRIKKDVECMFVPLVGENGYHANEIL
ncbi:MAG: protein-L-isoaspartate(D-aspartate) O-methyltransferase [Nitrososphaeria archaeon]